jgi:hypothetical protein
MWNQDKVSEQFSIRNDKFRGVYRPASIVCRENWSVGHVRDEE